MKELKNTLKEWEETRAMKQEKVQDNHLIKYKECFDELVEQLKKQREVKKRKSKVDVHICDTSIVLDTPITAVDPNQVIILDTNQARMPFVVDPLHVSDSEIITMIDDSSQLVTKETSQDLIDDDIDITCIEIESIH
jgi:hypothetical protein